MTRSCGDCSLCCKLPRIDELAKPADTWCSYCKPGKGGCTIYAGDRPQICHDFKCEWLKGDLPDVWRPIDSKIVVHLSRASADRVWLNVMVDLGAANRWREPDWYARIKQMAIVGHHHKILVRVQVGKRMWLVLPYQDDVEIPADTTKFDIIPTVGGYWKLKFTGAESDDHHGSSAAP